MVFLFKQVDVKVPNQKLRIVFWMIDRQSIISSSVITKGGAKRMISPWVGLANKPLSLSARQTSQAVLPSFGAIVMAHEWPLFYRMEFDANHLTE